MPKKPFGLAVKALVADSEGRWLLIRRSQESTWFKGQWDLPGGKVDPGEDFDVALRREVTEETGLEVALTGVAGAADWEGPAIRVVLLYMTATTSGGEIRTREGEHDAVMWVKPEAIADVDLSDQLRPFVLPYVESLLSRTGS